MKNVIRDTLVILQHDLWLIFKNPFWVFFGLFQPIVYLLLFYPFLKGVSQAPGFPAENTIQFFAPGLLVMNALANGAYAGFGLLNRLESGFLERMRVTPVSRTALVLGFVLGDAVQLFFQSLMLLAASFVFGLRVNVVGILLLFVLVLLVGTMLTAASHAVALIAKNTDGLVAVVNFFCMPMILLSGIMLPLSFAPRVIQLLSLFNPFRYAVDASRVLIEGSLSDPVIWYAFSIFTGLSIVTLWWFRRTTQEAVS